MNINRQSQSPEALKALRIRHAIAQAQTTCQDQGPNSPACELTWDRALTLQLEQFRQAQGHQKA